MPTLTPSERRTVERGVSDEVLSATVARLYKAENGARDYAYSGMLGAVMLVRSASGAFAFKLVDLNNGRVLWEHDASHNIKYQQDRPFFHSFVGSTCMIGFSFADEDEASTFFDKYARKESYVPQQPVPAPAPAPAPMAAFAPSAPPTGSMSRSSSGESIGSRPSKKESSGGGFFGRSKSKKDEKKKGKIDKSMISAPTNFEHVSHVGFNPKTGFSVSLFDENATAAERVLILPRRGIQAQNIPMEWKVIFQKAGITDDILKDKKAAKTVAKFMKEHAGDIAKASAAPPPALGAARSGPNPRPWT
ncbi:hypothetical protein HK105_200538 [Polyrhizophydium stewartii]|uniref:Uncharacterized protein n=1 Tax=Polyrhizophydium stewartii TaxID=2732419 RepID=A0ABR4NJA5_9FUNG